jgi:hypothetical protein
MTLKRNAVNPQKIILYWAFTALESLNRALQRNAVNLQKEKNNKYK